MFFQTVNPTTGEPVQTLTVRCELLGLVFAELVTNSAKHASPNSDDGMVHVKLGRKDQSWVRIVSDDGEVACPTPQGVGTKIIGRLVRLLGGGFAKSSGRRGTSAVVIFPCG